MLATKKYYTSVHDAVEKKKSRIMVSRKHLTFVKETQLFAYFIRIKKLSLSTAKWTVNDEQEIQHVGKRGKRYY
jgi:hypothetical protein